MSTKIRTERHHHRAEGSPAILLSACDELHDAEAIVADARDPDGNPGRECSSGSPQAQPARRHSPQPSEPSWRSSVREPCLVGSPATRHRPSPTPAIPSQHPQTVSDGDTPPDCSAIEDLGLGDDVAGAAYETDGGCAVLRDE